MATKRQWDSVINHWTRLSTGKTRGDESIGTDDCAFCGRYYKLRCDGCPISAKTGMSECMDTPYDDILLEYERRNFSTEFFDTALFRRLAKKELEFLKKLRKEVRGD